MALLPDLTSLCWPSNCTVHSIRNFLSNFSMSIGIALLKPMSLHILLLLSLSLLDFMCQSSKQKKVYNWDGRSKRNDDTARFSRKRGREFSSLVDQSTRHTQRFRLPLPNTLLDVYSHAFINHWIANWIKHTSRQGERERKKKETKTTLGHLVITRSKCHCSQPTSSSLPWAYGL